MGAKLLGIITPYAEKGILDVDAELGFCSAIEEALDGYRLLNADERVSITNQIYDALGFPHFWEG